MVYKGKRSVARSEIPFNCYTRSREILLGAASGLAILGSARSINNVSAESRNFAARAMNQRVCTRGNGAARNNLLRCKSDRMNRDGKQKLAPSRPQFRDIANGGRAAPKTEFLRSFLSPTPRES